MKYLSLLLCITTLFGNDFYTLMGEGTPRWKFLFEDRDHQVLKRYSEIYEQKLPLIDEQDDKQRIPKVGHLIWLGPKSFPIGSIDNVRSWVQHHPDWKFILWTDRKRMPIVEGMEVRFVDDFPFTKLRRYYDASVNWSEKADMLRFEILAAEGGVYFDHDALALRSFDDMGRNLDFYICLEMPHSAIDGKAITHGIGIVGIKPHHPLMLEVIEEVARKWDSVSAKFNTSDELTQFEKVMHRTYIAMTNVIERRLIRWGERDIVLPAAYFYPLEGLEGIYSKHLYGSSWNFYSNKSKGKFVHDKLKKPAVAQTRAFNWLIVYTGALLIVLFGILLCVRRRSYS
ncbi:MAG: hypothetical protein MRY21_01085 [Simkaniaceae bacterium]|nr:hypothetical protein [Simkaniaceae bacterium]